MKTSSLLARSAFGLHAVCCWLPLATGCGDSDERPAYEVPVAAEQEQTPVSELDDDQLQDICRSYSSYVDAEISFDALSQAVCLVAAQLGTLTPESCDSAYADCLANAPSPVSVRAEVEAGGVCRSALRECDATAAQLEGCLNVQLDALVGILDQLACGGSSDAARTMATDLMAGVSACANIDTRCGELTPPVELQ